MSKPWFDETTGLFKLDEYVAESPSFETIMKDGVVTDEEIDSQSQHVVTHLQALEKTLPAESRDQVLEVLTELSVLYAIQRTHERQEAEMHL
jgi:hypothetical protein